MVNTKSIDEVLSRAADAKEVPGVVAVAATDQGVVYEGAFGKRELGKDAPMTLDTVVWIASMTKAMTATAAMQLIERGKIKLEQPARELVAELSSPQVLEGFDASGQPRLRPAMRPMTVRHLLTHTAGFTYDIWSALMGQYQTYASIPGVITCQNAALTTPLLCEPGERWEYGISIDWVGKIVEAVSGQKLDRYLEEHICQPLGMHDTAFKISPSMRARLAPIHQRGDDGALQPTPIEVPQDPEFHMGGGGLYSTAMDCLAWAGLANTFYWIDPIRKLTGVFCTQILPFFDHQAIKLFRDYETAVYQ